MISLWPLTRRFLAFLPFPTTGPLRLQRTGDKEEVSFWATYFVWSEPLIGTLGSQKDNVGTAVYTSQHHFPDWRSLQSTCSLNKGDHHQNHHEYHHDSPPQYHNPRTGCELEFSHLLALWPSEIDLKYLSLTVLIIITLRAVWVRSNIRTIA